MIPMRLDKFLRDAKGLSRRQVGEAWEAGRIAVSQPLAHPGELVFPGDEVWLDGEPVSWSPPRHYIALHKPAGLITAVRDPRGKPCLDALMGEMPGVLFPVGRLDKETTGLLLLTDDGDLGYVLIDPERHVPKEYHLRLEGRVAPDDPRLGQLVDGVELGDGPSRALELRVVAATPTSTSVRMTIDEGRNRQVRRMVRAVGLWLEHLHRTRIGPLRLHAPVGPALEPGTWRALEPEEIEELWRAAGGRDSVLRARLDALRRKAQTWREQGREHARLTRWLTERS